MGFHRMLIIIIIIKILYLVNKISLTGIFYLFYKNVLVSYRYDSGNYNIWNVQLIT